MHSFSRPLAGRGGRWLPLTLCVMFVAGLWFSALPGLVYYEILAWMKADTTVARLDIGRYRATIEALPVEGLEDNLSGLTFSEKTGTLFAVINRPPQIVELSAEGRLLRRVGISGVSDPEGITHIAGDRFIISDERNQSLHWITIADDTAQIALGNEGRLKIGLGGMRNMGYEGLSWDGRHKRLYVAREMLPAEVIVIDGLEGQTHDGLPEIDIVRWWFQGLSGLFMLDFSSLSLHEPTGNLLLLSDMSSMLVEYGQDGAVLGVLPLWRGMHGLSRSIGQAEGLAVGSDGDIFIVSEPALFYRFSPQPSAS